MKIKLLTALLLIGSASHLLGQHPGIWASGTFTDARDGHVYNYVTLGSQTWMAENLAWLPAVGPSASGSNTSPFYYVYDYESTDVAAAKATTNYATYGVLYNWEAAKTACPSGWHLPTDGEWTDLTGLTNYLSTAGYGFPGSAFINSFAKAMADNSGWFPHETPGRVGNDQASNNLTGFTARPGGERDDLGFFTAITKYAFFWSSTAYDDTHAWERNLVYNYDRIYRYGSSFTKSYGMAVRCVRDEYHAAIKVFLEGAFNTGTGSMNTVLNTIRAIPLAQPYNTAPWNYAGTESVASVPAGVVDWVLVELHDGTHPGLTGPATLAAGWPKALFLKSDGTVVNTDGTTMPGLGSLSVVNNLYIKVQHRNHLFVNAASAAVATGSGYFYDFSTGLSKAMTGQYGYKLAGTTGAMAAGDIDQEGNIYVSDYNTWASGFGSAAGYYQADLDMDGNVYVSDYNKWASNFGLTIWSGPGPVRPKNTGRGAK